MQIGYTISGVAHVGLIGWVLFGGAFQPTSEPFEVTEVVAISEAEFDSLFNTTPPEVPSTDVVAPEVPDVPQDPPEDPAPVRPPPRPEPPQPVEPDPPAPPSPADDVTVIAPEPEAPEPEGPVTPEPLRPEAADRVAPTPVEQPDPEDQVADVAQEVETSDQAGEEQLPDQERTVEEAAATEIVTEAEEAEEQGLSRSLRPRLRPNRPEPPQEVAQQPAQEHTQSAVDDVLAGLASEQADTPSEPARPSGPPLSAGEKDALRVSVEKCWNTGSLSSAALRTTVVVSVALSEDGKPNAGSIRMLSSSGGTGGSVNQAFQAARRAIIRCGARGFPLPVEKFEQWREIEMTFNPEKMRIK
jgi:hypothetical protein